MVYGTDSQQGPAVSTGNAIWFSVIIYLKKNTCVYMQKGTTLLYNRKYHAVHQQYFNNNNKFLKNEQLGEKKKKKEKGLLKLMCIKVRPPKKPAWGIHRCSLEKLVGRVRWVDWHVLLLHFEDLKTALPLNFLLLNHSIFLFGLNEENRSFSFLFFPLRIWTWSPGYYRKDSWGRFKFN